MWDWFAHYWSSVGLGMALVLLALLFFTDVLRQRRDVARRRDPVWLSWAMAVAYLLHNFEEYGIDIMGNEFQFPATACQTYGFSGTEACPLTPAFFVAVNIPFVWIALVAAAVLARRNAAVGLTGAGLLLTNALSHIGGLATPMGYSPGTATSIVIFVPLSLWVFVTCFGRGKLRYPTMTAIILAAVLAQLVLLAMLAGLSTGTISEPLAILLQSLDPLLLLIIPWVANRTWAPLPPIERAPTTSALPRRG